MKPTLDFLLKENNFIISEIEKAEGEILDNIESIWESNTSAIMQKTDKIIELFDYFQMKLDYYSERIAEYQEHKQKLQQSILVTKEKFHNILEKNKVDKLSGSLGSVTKTFATHKMVDLDKVEENYRKYSFEVDYPTFKEIIKINPKIDYKRRALVSELPENHPAIIKSLTPSITIRKKRGEKNDPL